MDSHDDLYVADAAENAIVAYTDAGKQLAVDIKITAPAGLAFDAKGYLYASRFEGNNYDVRDVYVFNAKHQLQKSLTLHTEKRSGWYPAGIAFDSSGNPWVANRYDYDYGQGEIQVFKGTKVVKTIAGDMAYPLGIAFSQSTHDAWVGDAENLAAASCAPAYIAFSKSGDVYVPCTIGSNAVLVFNQSGKLLDTISQGLDYPIGLAFDRASNFFVSNAAANTIEKFSPSGKLLLTIQ